MLFGPGGARLTDCWKICHHDPPEGVGKGKVDILEHKVDCILLEFADSDAGARVFSCLHGCSCQAESGLACCHSAILTPPNTMT